MQKDKVERLYEIYPILQRINIKNKNRLESKFQFKVLNQGELLRGGECPGLIFIIKGAIKIERIDEEGRQTHLYQIRAGEFCHQSISCQLECESLEIVGCALVETEVAMLPRGIVQEQLLEDLDFVKYLYKNLYSRFKLVIGHKAEIIHESIEERVVKFLIGKGSTVIYMTHQEIALEVGSSREVISRKLKELEREGVVELGRGKIKLKKL